MKNVISSIMDSAKTKTSVAIICGALIIMTGTGAAIATNVPVSAAQSNSVTAANSLTTVTEVEKFAAYEEFGLTYDKTTGRLYFNGELVRYFEDYFPVGDNTTAGVDHFDKNGTIDVRAIRDFSQVILNSDGSINPSGKLMGLEPYSLTEFTERNTDSLQNPQQSTANTGGATDADETQNPQQSTAIAGGVTSPDEAQNPEQFTANAGGATSTDELQNPPQLVAFSGNRMTPDELAKEYSIYEPFGVTYDKTQDRFYYNGKSVRVFYDIMNSNGESATGGQFSGSVRVLSFPDGEIDISTIRDFNNLDVNGFGKLIGIEIIN